MPALPAVPKGLKVILRGQDGADVNVDTILHFVYTGTAPTAADLNEMADDIVSAWSTNVSPLQTNQSLLLGAEVIDLTSATGAVGFSSAPSNSGGGGAFVLPAGTAMVA